MNEKRLRVSEVRAVIERAESVCEYCRSPESFSMTPFAVEHVIPRSRGGKTYLDNVAWSCLGCNGHKFNKVNGRDPETGKLVPLFHPRQQKWTDHFEWTVDGAYLIGLTPTGRATIRTLKLNRKGLVNLRRVLLIAGEHPWLSRG
jgi:HNH endonuclease